MKKDIHPKNYRKVIFADMGSEALFLIGSTVATDETGMFEGKKYPKVSIEVSSASHPYYTGEEKVIDTAGRVEKFKARAKAAAERRKSVSK